MALETFDGTDSNYTGGFLQVGSWILEGGILRITGTAPSGDSRILWESSSNGNLSIDLVDPKSSQSYAGIFFRATDANNGFHWLNRANDNRCRLIKVIGGVTQSPDLIDFTPSGVNGGSNRSLSVELSGSTIRCFQNGAQVGGDITDAFQQDATLHGVRVGANNVDFDNFAYPDPASNATKTVTFSLHEDIQGLNGVNYIITPAPLGDSITSGVLDTSGTTVTIDLDAFTSLNVGDTLLMIATDKQEANDNADVIAWDASTVVGA